MEIRHSEPVIEPEQKRPCKKANTALILAIVGIFLLGVVLEPIAIFKALKARKMIKADPKLTGEGKATAAIIIAIICITLWTISIILLIGLAIRFKQM
jgi:hypothetical protein